jgi:hypothetical protein
MCSGTEVIKGIEMRREPRKREGDNLNRGETNMADGTKFRYLPTGFLIVLLGVLVVGGLLLGAQAASAKDDSAVFAPGDRAFGKSLADWAAEFWKWGLRYPVAGHPFTEDPSFDFAARQSGSVWFWGAPNVVGFTRNVRIPAGKAILLSMLDVEASTLEEPPFYGATAQEQAAIAKFYADRIGIGDLFLTIDGEPVDDLAAYRTASPQVTVKVPTPWIFGETGGKGTSSGDGYYVLIKPLPPGTHTIHYGGVFHFQAGDFGEGSEPFDLPKDVTIELTVY